MISFCLQILFVGHRPHVLTWNLGNKLSVAKKDDVKKLIELKLNVAERS